MFQPENNQPKDYDQLFTERLAELDPTVAAGLGRISLERNVSRQTILDIMALMDVEYTLRQEDAA